MLHKTPKFVIMIPIYKRVHMMLANTCASSCINVGMCVCVCVCARASANVHKLISIRYLPIYQHMQNMEDVYNVFTSCELSKRCQRHRE
jgi:hypothetical protein